MQKESGMRPEFGFPGKTRVVKFKGHGVGRTGLVVENDGVSGTWMVLFDDRLVAEKVNPYEFQPAPKGAP